MKRFKIIWVLFYLIYYLFGYLIEIIYIWELLDIVEDFLIKIKIKKFYVYDYKLFIGFE